MAKPTAFAYRTVGWLLLATLALLVGKAAGRLAWSWWWVTVPLWGPWVGLLLVAGGYSIWRLLAARQ